jgi:hypothetical protein
MDMQAFEADLKVEIVKLPKELIAILKKLATEFGPMLEKLVPDLLDKLGRHIGTAVMEQSMGILDKTALNEAVMKVLRETV